MSRTKRDQKPTCVSLVEDAMRVADDFVTAKQLCVKTGCNANQVSAALYLLQKHHAADCVESAKQLWWFATSATDTRHHKVEMRTPEDKPRKVRQTRAKEAKLMH